jgi:hypothetical protein
MHGGGGKVGRDTACSVVAPVGGLGSASECLVHQPRRRPAYPCLLVLVGSQQAEVGQASLVGWFHT